MEEYNRIVDEMGTVYKVSMFASDEAYAFVDSDQWSEVRILTKKSEF